MLEPLFRCNLACAGCGKIDYFKRSENNENTKNEFMEKWGGEWGVEKQKHALMQNLNM